MIDRARVLEQQLAERYLAGQLTPEESREFEEAMLEHPEVLEQVELGRTVKLGLATLRERGELETLVRARPRKQPWWFAAAAALAICAFGLLWLARHQAPAILAASLDRLDIREGHGLAAGEVLIARTRGTEAISIEASAAEPVIALRVLAPASRAGKIHSVELLRNREHVATLEAMPTGDYLHLYLDTSRLEAGDYGLVVRAPDESSPETTYPLRLIRTEP